jgi:hypothetical protein
MSSRPVAQLLDPGPLGFADASEVFLWNDAPWRTADEVIGLIDRPSSGTTEEANRKQVQEPDWHE